MATAVASYIPDEKVREIREACSIVAVISDYVTLTKTGTNYKGLCPFHHEKTPSFFVNESKKMFHCFGCGASGDVFTFLIKRENVSFPEAVTMLARRCGISLPEKPLTQVERKRLSEREEFFRINQHVAAFYHQTLLHDARAADARRYLQQRGITSDTIREFSLGYAPDAWESVTNFLRTQQLSLSAAQRIGLIVKKGDDHYYDRFRGRIIFPVFNVARQVIGFGGRVIGDGEPKYLNSPESALYSKRETLYGLPQAAAAIQHHNYALVVEGYFDLLSLHQAGIANAVAALGTALTEQQIKTLRRYTQHLVIVFDADLAGQKAMIRSLEPLLRSGVSPRLVVLPSGEDPDSFVRRCGAAAFQEKVSRAPLLFNFVLEKTIAEHDLATPRGKVLACDAVLPLLHLITDPLERELYMQQIAQRLGVNLHQLRQRHKVKTAAPAPDQSAGTGKEQGASLDKDAEAIILKLMVHHPDILPTVDATAVLEDFVNPDLKTIGTAILTIYQQHQRLDLNAVTALLPEPALQAQLAQFAFQDDVANLSSAKMLHDCIRAIRMKKNRAERRRISLLLKQAEATQDETATRSLQIQYAQLIEQEKKISQRQLDSIHR